MQKRPPIAMSHARAVPGTFLKIRSKSVWARSSIRSCTAAVALHRETALNSPCVDAVGHSERRSTSPSSSENKSSEEFGLLRKFNSLQLPLTPMPSTYRCCWWCEA
jgi:hypothetical protein